ncbi:MAG: recombinase family protein [Patescibacteria group bacterium]|nr:recombinase family protein [Patescibacteria group bacterium]
MKAAIYTRVSTNDQKTDMQTSELHRYFKNQNWKIEAEFTETASGTKNDRPKRAELLKLCRQKKINTVVVWKLDRWGRSVQDLVTTLNEFRETGINFISITEAIDLSTPSGRALAQMLAVFAEFQREIIKENVLAGQARYRADNDDWGRPATAMAKSEQVLALKAQRWPRKKIAAEVGISTRSVSRILKQHGGQS